MYVRNYKMEGKTITISSRLWNKIQELSKQMYVNQPDCPVELKDLDDPRTLEIYDVGENDGKIDLAWEIIVSMEVMESLKES